MQEYDSNLTSSYDNCPFRNTRQHTRMITAHRKKRRARGFFLLCALGFEFSIPNNNRNKFSLILPIAYCSDMVVGVVYASEWSINQKLTSIHSAWNIYGSIPQLWPRVNDCSYASIIRLIVFSLLGMQCNAFANLH